MAKIANLPQYTYDEDHFSALYYLHDSSGDTVFYNEYDDVNDGTVGERWERERDRNILNA